ADADADADADKDRDYERIDNRYGGDSGKGYDGSGDKLPKTATHAWAYGAAGVVALLSGLFARVFGRNRKNG
ncbi:LPXTG cell wall anchor domain-containing protein, partial [Shouchella miscanthi]